MWNAFLAIWYVFLPNDRKLQFRIFKGQKWLKLWHKRKTKFLWCMGVILHSLGTQLHHTWPSISCGTAGHPTCEVWPLTPHNYLVFSKYLPFLSDTMPDIWNICARKCSIQWPTFYGHSYWIRGKVFLSSRCMLSIKKLAAISYQLWWDLHFVQIMEKWNIFGQNLGWGVGWLLMFLATTFKNLPFLSDNIEWPRKICIPNFLSKPSNSDR